MSSKSSKINQGSASGGSAKGPQRLKKINVDMAQRGNPTQDLARKRQVLPKIKSNTEKFHEMLAGSLTDLLPKSPSEVRIFLSSTFSDYRSERNWLPRDAYRQLQEFCADHELDFRVVDMRWGVTDDATNEHITEKLCLSEIATCKRVSLGPNFVCMLGNRYGYQPLPFAFIAKEFDILYKEAKEIQHPHADVLKKWYNRDDNNIPPVYCLTPISSVIPNFGNHTAGMDEERREATARWNEELLVIHDVLRSAASSLAAKKIITDSRKHDFYKSVTEVEVTEGIIEAQNPNDHALCYLRYLDGLNESRLSDNNALRNIDGLKVDGKLALHKEVVKYQNTLKEGRVPTHLKSLNVRRYEIPWEDGGVDPEKHQSHKQYIAKFCRDFVHDVQTLITRAVDQKEKRIPVSEYYTDPDDLIHHAHFCVAKCEVFRGQEKPLAKIRDYLSNQKNNKPLTIYAQSGIGKTSILAMAFKSIPQWFGKDAVRMIRFLGTSPDTGTLGETLRAVMFHLADAFKIIVPPLKYNTVKRVLDNFAGLLRLISRKTKEPVFIFLDSIDQLNPRDGAFSMKWLPTELPARIHIILSVIPNYGNILDNTRKMIKDSNCFVEVHPLPIDTGKDIIDSYLKMKGRKVTKEQEKLLTECLQNEPSPLFLKLFLDKALSWRSDTAVDTIRVESSVREAITHLFEDLEAKYGKCLIQRSLGYITVGMDGLSELEIEDVLSCDDSVLDEVYVYHDPPVEGTIRIPPLLWSRVRIHINEYLTERTSFGKTTMYWYHRQFIEVAEERYARNGDAKTLHRRLAELYLSENGVKKDITLSRRKNKTIARADRQVTPQPMTSRNRRMLEALPFHLRNAQNTAYMKQVALCNLRFLMTRMLSFGIDRVIKDLTDALAMCEKEPDDEIETILNALKAAKPSLRSPSQIPLQLLARLQHDRKGSPHIANLLDNARKHLDDSPDPQVAPLYPCLVNTSQIVWLGQNAELKSCSGDNTKYVLSVPKKSEDSATESPEVVVLDAVNQQVLIQKEAVNKSDFPIITGDGKKLISVHELKSAPEKPSKRAKNGPPPPKVGEFVISIVDYDSLTKAEGSTTRFLSLAELKIKELYAFGVSNDGLQVALVYNDAQLTLFDAKTSSVIRSEKLESLGESAVVRWFGKGFCVVVSEDSSQLSIVSMDVKKQMQTVQLPGRMVSESTVWLSSSNELVLSCTKDDIEDIVSINLKSAQIKDGLWPKESKISLNIPLPGETSLLMTPDSKVFELANSRAPLTEWSVSGSGSALGNALCGCCDGSTILIGTKSGLLVAYKKTEEGMAYIGQTTVSDGPLRSLHLNEDEEVLLCISDDTAKLWNWQLLRQKLSASNSKSPSKAGPINSTIGFYNTAAAFAITPCSSSVVTVSKTDKVTVWNIASQEKVKIFGKAVDPKHTTLAVGGSILMTLDRKEKKLYAWETDSGTELDALKYLHGSTLAFTKNPNSDIVYIFSEVDGKYGFTVIDMAQRKITHTFRSTTKEKFDSMNIELAISGSEKYLFLIVEATPIQLSILRASEKKNNLKESVGNLLFYAVDLRNKSGDLIQSKRQLSTVPALGESYLAHRDSTLILGRSRLTTVWEVESGTNDQRMVKGTKIAQFFRPEWIEDYPSEHMKYCHGKILTIVRSAGGDVISTGSADGYVMFFNAEKGVRIGGNMKDSKPHHQGQVTNVALSPNGKWAASYGTEKFLKFWCLPQKEITSLKLELKICQMTFADDNQTVAVLGVNGVGQSSMLLFRIVGNISNV